MTSESLCTCSHTIGTLKFKILDVIQRLSHMRETQKNKVAMCLEHKGNLYMRGVHRRAATQTFERPMSVTCRMVCATAGNRPSRMSGGNRRCLLVSAVTRVRPRGGGVSLLLRSNSRSVSASQKTEVSGPRCTTSPSIPSSNGASPCWCWRSLCCSQSK